MVPSSSAALLVIATTLLAVTPSGAAPASGVADFLMAIGGDTELKTSGSRLSDPSPQLYPLARDSGEIIGYRFFSEKLAANGSATAERAKAAFVQECTAKGGQIAPEDGKVARSFRERVLDRRLPPRGSFKHFWSGLSAVCARSPSEVMGGFVAITFDNTELATKGDFGAKLFSKISLMKTGTVCGVVKRSIHLTAGHDPAFYHLRRKHPSSCTETHPWPSTFPCPCRAVFPSGRTHRATVPKAT